MSGNVEAAESGTASLGRISRTEMYELIKKAESESLENEAYYLSSKSLVMNIGDSERLCLITNGNGSETEGVQWFCRTCYPYNTVYDARESMPHATVIS